MGCSSVLYYPTRHIYVDLGKLKPAPQEKQLQLEDKVISHGWFFKAEGGSSKGTILFFHGNGQNRSAQFLNLYWLVREGYDLAIYDYPGYGQTAGTPSPESTVKMAIAAIRATHAELHGKRFVVYGQSLGGAIAARAVWELRDDIQPDLLIIDSSFLSYQRTAKKILARSAWTWILQPFAWLLLSDRWAPEERLHNLHIRTIVIHSRVDEIIPFKLGQEVFDHAPSPKEFWIKEHGQHNQTYEGEEGLILKQRLRAALQSRDLSVVNFRKRQQRRTTSN
jgi:pimeloyl-ACP methyl ester carboxylesterase